MRLIWPLVLVLALVSHGYALSLTHVYEPVQMPNGEAVSGASVYVYLPNTTTEVTIYEDAAGASPITQPETTTSGGMMSFYAYPGTYDLYIVYSPWSVATTWEDYAVGAPGGWFTLGGRRAWVTDVWDSAYFQYHYAAMSARMGIVATQAGSITALSATVVATSVPEPMSLVIQFRVNGTTMLSDTLAFTTTASKGCYKTSLPGAVTFAAGDTLSLYGAVTDTFNATAMATALCVYH
jgi:hypothetical protein